MVQELALRASSIVGRLGQLDGHELRPDFVNDFSYFPAQRLGKVDLQPSSRSAVPHMPMRYRHLKHFLEAERLCAQLKVRGRTVPYAGLVLDGTNRSVLHFNGVGAARQSQFLRPERDRPQHVPSPLLAMPPAIHPPVRPSAPDGVGVVAPDAVAVDEGALSRAVREVLDRGDAYDGFGGHSRVAPNARVESAELRRWNWTVRHAAWTPSGAQVSSRSGIQESMSASIPSLSSSWLHAGQ